MSDAVATRSTLLLGIKEIAAHLGVTEGQTRYLAAKASIPVFKLPNSSMLCARRETLDAYLRDLAAAALQAAEGARVERRGHLARQRAVARGCEPGSPRARARRSRRGPAID